MADTKDLNVLLDAQVPIIGIESPDETRVLALLLRFAMQQQLSYFSWTVTRGLVLAGFGERPGEDAPAHEKPEAVLKHIAATPGPALYVLCDFHPYLANEPKHVRYLKDIALGYERNRNTVVLVSHKLDIPVEISRVSANLKLRLPSDEELMGMVRTQAKSWSRANGRGRVRTDEHTLKKLIANLRGVSHSDAEILIRHAIYRDGAITESDIPAINKLKFELMDADGVLHFEYDTERFSSVAGLHNLKAWLELRRNALLEAQTDRPKGILLLGVQGGGKSLAAKAVAGFWSIPLLRLDFGALYNKYFGETERNLRNSLKQAEQMAPCVLWMDEIEKGLATGQTDNATSQRVLGTLLTWMAENQQPVFIVATSNDNSSLPTELMRKGRLDEIFFVDLPDADVRQEIFRIHLGKRDLNADAFDLVALAEAAADFTGAEIEEAVVSARYLASARDGKITQQDILASLGRTYPISVLKAESIQSLRTWAADRTVPA
jgi:SpoVK/Ycf46/Vps4 family AAA+-type ATPase